MEATMAETEDRISDLGDEILHQILSFLPMKFAAQTTVLSRRWKHIWDSCPVFDFCQNSVLTRRELNLDVNGGISKQFPPLQWKALEKLTNIVDHGLQKFCEYKIGIQKFKLSITLVDPKFDSSVERWMEVVSEQHVKELDLYIKAPGDYRRRYVLPQAIFAAKSLTVLKIRGDNVILEYPVMKCAVGLHSLRALSLDNVRVDKESIQNLIRSCPSVEELCLSFNEYTLESLNVFGLVNLVNLTVSVWIGIYLSTYIPMKLSRCEGLRRVSLYGVLLDCVFDDINFPQVEFISLSSSRFRKDFKICSHQLKTLVIEDCLQDQELDIFAPNLISVRHGYDCHPRYRFLPYLNAHCKLKVQVRALGRSSVSTAWYIRLKECLQEQKQTKTLEVSFNLVEVKFDREEAETSNCHWPPHALECLVIDMRSPLDYAAVMDGFFWCSRPQVLSIRSYHICFIEFLFEMFDEGKKR